MLHRLEKNNSSYTTGGGLNLSTTNVICQEQIAAGQTASTSENADQPGTDASEDPPPAPSPQ